MNLRKAVPATLIAASAFMSTSATAVAAFAECVGEPKARFSGSIVDAAIATPELSTLVTAVTAADLGDLLATTQDITVFAPTNDAFDRIPENLLNEILADGDVLTAVLAYHVTPGIVDPRVRISPFARNTLADQEIFIYRKDGEQQVNGSIVSCTGVRADNGVVWFIDSVMMPQL